MLLGGPGKRCVVLMNQSSWDYTLLDVRLSPEPGRGAVSRQSSRDKRCKRSLPGSTVRDEGRAISVNAETLWILRGTGCRSPAPCTPSANSARACAAAVSPTSSAKSARPRRHWREYDGDFRTTKTRFAATYEAVRSGETGPPPPRVVDS